MRENVVKCGKMRKSQGKYEKHCLTSMPACRDHPNLGCLDISRNFSKSLEISRDHIPQGTLVNLLLLTYTYLNLHIMLTCTCQQLWTYAGDLHMFTCTCEFAHVNLRWWLAHVNLHVWICTCAGSHATDFRISLTILSLVGGGGTHGVNRNATLCAEIVRFERAGCRWNCVSGWAYATLCGDRACRRCGTGEIAFLGDRMQPSAEIVRVKGAKCRWGCVFGGSRTTLCGDRACRRRRMCDVAFVAVPMQPSADIVRVEGAECVKLCFCMLSRFLGCLLIILFLARYAGKKPIFLEKSLVENVPFGSVDSHFLQKFRGQRSFWKSSFSVFGKVWWKTLVLEGFILSFWEALVLEGLILWWAHVLGVVASRCWKWSLRDVRSLSSREFTFARCGRLRQRLRGFSELTVLGAVASCWKLNLWAVVPTPARFFLGSLSRANLRSILLLWHREECAALFTHTWIHALANLRLCTYTDACLPCAC